MTNSFTDPKVRIDKWLWSARFFKTRALASTAVNGGKVHLNGQRIKASRAVKLNDMYEIQRGFERIQIVVDQLASRRGPASVAQTLYTETDKSIATREKEAEQRKLSRLQHPVMDHRPSKKERRNMLSFTGKK
ncbi:MAG: RNA-binding protein [Gammaproteobacteria bacterium]|nr:RNA-binding protein [Gammaproteobacteria bacterium]